MRNKSSAFLFIATLALAAAGIGSAEASTYNLVLTSTSGPESGTGSFTVTTPVLGTSPFDTAASLGGNGALTAMTFTIDGMTFNLANATSAGVGFDYNGVTEVLNNIGYTGELSSFVFQLSTGGFTYSFSDSANSRLNSSGTIAATLVPTTPIGATLPLFASGLAAIGLLGRGKKRKVAELATA